MTIQSIEMFRTLSLKPAMLRTVVAAVGILAIAGQGAAAQLQRQNAAPVGGLTAVEGRAQVTPIPCNTPSSCNQVISYCYEHGGTWLPESYDGIGRPSSGTCYIS